MTLTEEQIDYIATNLEFYGVESEELRNDLLDHICTYIESGDFFDFDTAYRDAVQKFGGYSAMGNLDRDTYLLTTFRQNLRRQKWLQALGLACAVLLSVGALFKFMHWPLASIIACLGFVVLILGFLPMYFYQRYRNYHKKMIAK